LPRAFKSAEAGVPDPGRRVLHDEVRALGYRGSKRTVRRFESSTPSRFRPACSRPTHSRAAVQQTDRRQRRREST
jgi:hypothetical protein